MLEGSRTSMWMLKSPINKAGVVLGSDANFGAKILHKEADVRDDWEKECRGRYPLMTCQ